MLDQAAKRVATLAVCEEFPVRSLEEYVVKNKGADFSVMSATNLRRELEGELSQGGYERIATPVTEAVGGRRLYYTISEACLAALQQHVECQMRVNGDDPGMLRLLDGPGKGRHLKEKEMWMSLKQLLPAIDRLLRPECPGKLTRHTDDDYGATFYLEQATRSMEFFQITKLETLLDSSGPRIKRHKWKGSVHYELLPAGYDSATVVRSRRFPEPPGHYRVSKITTLSQLHRDYDGNICLGVDLREGGGGAKILHNFCNILDQVHVPYFVGTIAVGDYVFFTRKPGAAPTEPLNYLCPIIVERKSIEDIAMSIHDGRWKKQKQRMYIGQYVFGYDNCRMVYIIEGNDKKQTVSGNYVGARWFDVNVERVNAEIKNLEEEGFEVIRTPSIKTTMYELSRWSKRIATEIKSGELTVELTYEEFKKKCSEVSRETDFSRLAKYYYKNRKEEEEKEKEETELERKLPARNLGASSLLEETMELERKRPARNLGLSSSMLSQDSARDSVGSSRPSDGLKSYKKQKQGGAAKENYERFASMSSKALKDACAEVGLKTTGSKSDLIERLRDTAKYPPQVLLKRKRTGQYVPQNHNVGSSALLVAMYLNERDTGNPEGLTKEELYVKAESLNITNNPFSGGTTQTGPYHYDGWTNMRHLRREEDDQPLVKRCKSKFRLTRNSAIAGYEIAKAVHSWNHAHDNCPCGNPN